MACGTVRGCQCAVVAVAENRQIWLLQVHGGQVAYDLGMEDNSKKQAAGPTGGAGRGVGPDLIVETPGNLAGRTAVKGADSPVGVAVYLFGPRPRPPLALGRALVSATRSPPVYAYEITARSVNN